MMKSAAVLAWRLLTHDPGRLAASVGGIAFAALLIFVQLGFRNCLLDSSLALVEALDADILLIQRHKAPFLHPQPLRRQRLQQASAIEGVAEVRPLWFAVFYWRNIETDVQRPVRVIGIEPGDPIFVSDETNTLARKLHQPDTALLDTRGRAALGRAQPGPGQIERRSVEVIGTLDLGTDIIADGHVVVSRRTFLALAPRLRDWPEAGLVKTARGQDPEELARRINSALPDDVVAYTKDQLYERDWESWKRGTPVSKLVTLGMTMGFLIGVGICYQILFIDITDHLSEFATAKAIGYGPRFLGAVVVTEALVLAILGFVPALVLSAGIYQGLASATGLVVRLTIGRASLVLGVSVGMCLLASSLALRRVLEADPAELF